MLPTINSGEVAEARVGQGNRLGCLVGSVTLPLLLVVAVCVNQALPYGYVPGQAIPSPTFNPWSSMWLLLLAVTAFYTLGQNRSSGLSSAVRQFLTLCFGAAALLVLVGGIVSAQAYAMTVVMLIVMVGWGMVSIALAITRMDRSLPQQGRQMAITIAGCAITCGLAIAITVPVIQTYH